MFLLFFRPNHPVNGASRCVYQCQTQTQTTKQGFAFFCILLTSTVFMPPPFEEWWRGIKCYPCPCVRACGRPSVRASVRPSVIKIWCLLNNFCKTASVQFKFGMLIYNIKTQVDFDYNPLIFDRVMALL